VWPMYIRSGLQYLYINQSVNHCKSQHKKRLHVFFYQAHAYIRNSVLGHLPTMVMVVRFVVINVVYRIGELPINSVYVCTHFTFTHEHTTTALYQLIALFVTFRDGIASVRLIIYIGIFYICIPTYVL